MVTAEISSKHTGVLESTILGVMRDVSGDGMSDDALFNYVTYHFHKQTSQSLSIQEYDATLEQMRARGKVGYLMTCKKGEERYRYFPAGIIT